MNVNLLVKYDDEAKCWVACCQNFCMVSQSKDRPALWQAFAHVFFGSILISLEHGHIPTFKPPMEPEGTGWEHATIDLWDYKPEWLKSAFGKLIASWTRVMKAKQWLGHWNDPNQRVILADGSMGKLRSVVFRSTRAAAKWTPWMNVLVAELYGPDFRRFAVTE